MLINVGSADPSLMLIGSQHKVAEKDD